MSDTTGRFSRATLRVFSDTHPASAVSGILRLTPTEMHEKGDPRVRRDGRTREPYPMSMWHLDADISLNDPDDESGYAAVRVLLDAIGDRATEFAALSPHYRPSILWTGDTGKGRDGFSIPPDVMAGIGRLGCRFDGTVLNFDDDDDEPPQIAVGEHGRG